VYTLVRVYCSNPYAYAELIKNNIGKKGEVLLRIVQEENDFIENYICSPLSIRHDVDFGEGHTKEIIRAKLESTGSKYISCVVGKMVFPLPTERLKGYTFL